MKTITSKSFQLTKYQYYKILLRKYFQRRIWFYVFLWIVTIFISLIDINFVTILLILYAFLYPLIICLVIYRRAIKADSQIFTERKIEFKQNILTVYFSNNTQTEIKKSSISKIVNRNKYCMLYISKNQFIYIPVKAFDNIESYYEFLNLLRN